MADLLALPADALRAILCRVPAKDHTNLRLTCQAVSVVLGSEEFRQERSLSKWQETHVSLVSKEELYKRDNEWEYKENGFNQEDMREYYSELGGYDSMYRFHDVEARIWVDGKLGGEASLVLVEGSTVSEGHFHEAADAHSSELQCVGMEFCDKWGRARVQSVKDANADASGGFLYIKKLEVHAPHCENTNVAAAAIKSLLCDTKLSGTWTLAVYLADARVHYNEEDSQRDNRVNDPYRYDSGNQSEDTKKRDKEIYLKRWDELAKLDVRQFMRVGFKQAPEMLGEGNPYQFFASPVMLATTLPMSHDEALALPFIEKPILPDEPSGVDKELLELVLKACTDRNWKQGDLETANGHGAQEASRDGARLQRIVQEITDLDANFQNNVLRLVNEKGASIKGSNVLQGCACHQVLEYVEFLLGLLESRELESAINSFDPQGITPLMAAAQGFSEKKKYTVCEKLLRLGADRNVVNALDGKTALGYFRFDVRGSNDFASTKHIVGRRNSAETLQLNEGMERLLMPTTGPTTADNAAHQT